jgi:hypothetical protein
MMNTCIRRYFRFASIDSDTFHSTTLSSYFLEYILDHDHYTDAVVGQLLEVYFLLFARRHVNSYVEKEEIE